jgi:hypothetical protein
MDKIDVQLNEPESTEKQYEPLINSHDEEEEFGKCSYSSSLLKELHFNYLL